MMKRKEYRDRTQVLLSVERDRWNDFMDICDKEKKSASFKFDEMMTEELQKNALGVAREPNPLNIHTYVSDSHKPLQQPTLDTWLAQVYAAKDDERRLNLLEGDALTVASAAKDLRKQAFRNRILKR